MIKISYHTILKRDMISWSLAISQILLPCWWTTVRIRATFLTTIISNGNTHDCVTSGRYTRIWLYAWVFFPFFHQRERFGGASFRLTRYFKPTEKARTPFEVCEWHHITAETSNLPGEYSIIKNIITTVIGVTVLSLIASRNHFLRYCHWILFSSSWCLRRTIVF